MFGAATTFGRQVDSSALLITGICAGLFVMIVFLMVYFVVRYRSSRSVEAARIEGNTVLEISWTAGGVAIVLFMFYIGWFGYGERKEVPPGAFEIRVTAQMWQWSFEYGDGRRSDTLYLPANRPVKMVLNSRDVIHSFYVPAFRIKEDVVPGMTKAITFVADEAGEYDLFCTEYCGTGHSGMYTSAVVLAEADFDDWSRTVSAEPTLSGEELIKEKGCTACHTTDGSTLVCPTFKGLWGRTERVATGGKEREVFVDEEYMRRSMLEPASDVVVGFPPIMPSQEGILTEEEIKAITEYIKTLKN